MSLSVFNRKVITVTQQLVAENINLFNGATNNALILGNSDVIADYVEEASLGLIAGLVSERNPYAPAGTDANLKVLAQLLKNSVNLSGKVGPFVITTGMMSKINRDAASVAASVSAQATQGVMQMYLKSALTGLTAAISSNSKAVYTQPARINAGAQASNLGKMVVTLQDFPLAAGLFGDAASMINTWFMTGAQWANLIAFQAIPNVEQLFTIGNINVMGDGLGRRFVVTDALSGTAGIADTVLGLTQGAAAITTTGVTMKAGERLGGENIENILQGEFDYSLSIKGYKLKASYLNGLNGSVSAKLADIGNKSNWELPVAAVDNAPLSIDRVDGAPTTGANAATGTKKQQAAQGTIAFDVKETAGVLIKLTETTAPATTN